MTAPAVITQAQIVRAIKAVKKAGANMAVECRPDGVIRIVPNDNEKEKFDNGEDFELY